MKSLVLAVSVLSLIGSSFLAPAHATHEQKATLAPEKGWLVLEGGGKLRNTEVLKRFVSLAGGSSARLVEIPTASIHNMGRKYDADYIAGEVQWCQGVFGIDQVALLHTDDRKEADADAFVEPLRHANAVWISGGDDKPLYDVYAGTRVEEEIKRLFARGGVVGGTSAGATLLGLRMVEHTSLAGAPSSIMEPSNPEKEAIVGFSLLKHCVIDPHFFNRHRENDMAKFIERNPNLLGLGIDETTAVIVHGEQFEVVGEGQVGVFDGKQHGDKKYVVLSNGQKFDLKNRVVIN